MSSDSTDLSTISKSPASEPVLGVACGASESSVASSAACSITTCSSASSWTLGEKRRPRVERRAQAGRRMTAVSLMDGLVISVGCGDVSLLCYMFRTGA